MKRFLFCAFFIASLCPRAHAEDVSVSSSTLPPKNWKTYTNQRYGFQFKYPPVFQVSEGYKLNTKWVFTTKINGGLLAVTLLYGGEYAGFSVIVQKKEVLFFHTKVLPGFYKYDSTLNTWLGYNPVSTEYGNPLKTYFHIGEALCAQGADTVGPAALPSYGTTRLVPKTSSRNDVLLTNQTFGLEIPREDTGLEIPLNEDLTEIQEKIRNTFTCLKPVQVLKADCTSAALGLTTQTFPALAEPRAGQIVDSQKPLRAVFDKKLPAGFGAVFYLNSLELGDVEKIVFESPVGDASAGDQVLLNFENVLLPPPSETGTTPMSLHVFFYKVVKGRKVLLGNAHSFTTKLLLK